MKSLILKNDDITPIAYALRMLQEVLNLSLSDARLIMRNAHSQGEAVCGLYDDVVADKFFESMKRHIDNSGYPLKVELRPAEPATNDSENSSTNLYCSFCRKAKDRVELLISGKDANICDECIDLCLDAIHENKQDAHFKFAHELLGWQFKGLRNDEIVTANREFPMRVRADLQLALDSLFAEKTPIRFVGVHGGYRDESLDIPKLMEKSQHPKLIGPLQYIDIDIGEPEPVKSLKNALWLFEEDTVRYIILLSQRQNMYGEKSINIEFGAPAGEASETISHRFFRALEQAVSQSRSYRGKVLSLEQNRWYNGMSGEILVHKLRKVTRDQIILPEMTVRLLESNVIAFAEQRERLKAMKLSGKKGLLFHGPPGTGKTHTVQYLARHLPDHTTLLITAEQIGMLREYFLLARLLQPAIVVVEDVDLFARARTSMTSPCEEALLNTLLNEMDGLREDAEIFFILTTNRPEMLESALAARPGRVDQAIEFPLPDFTGRKNLIALYAGDLELAEDTITAIAERTEDVSAAFIKELMRRASQYYLDDGAVQLEKQHIDSALEEMLFSGGTLNVRLLGGNEVSKEGSSGEAS